jgi:hypothetical protein
MEFCLLALSLARHVAPWLCSSLDSAPEGKIPFGVTRADFSDSLQGFGIASSIVLGTCTPLSKPSSIRTPKDYLKSTCNHFIRTLVLTTAIFLPLILRADPPGEVTLPSLLDEMVDRDALAQWPVPGYTLKEESSHDRSKTDPSNAKTWHSNQDFGNFLRTETNEGRQEWVIMDAQGAGVITRWWTPIGDGKEKQIVRFYFDGATTPSLSMNYFDLLDGRGLARPPFAFLSWNQKDVQDELKPDYDPNKVYGRNAPGAGADLYLPISFAKGCKVTLDSVPFYYVINYRIYDPGTVVKTFTASEFDAANGDFNINGALGRATKTLLDPPPTSAGANMVREATLAPNGTANIDLPAGSAAIQSVEVQIDPKDTPQVLRSLVLQATFDGEPSIWCPLGDFFGAGARLNAVHDWDRSVNEDGTLTARWVMPYQRTGQLSLQNLGNKPIRVKLSVVTKPWRWDDRSMIFHANWHSQHGILTRPRSDWNYIEITGKGVYVGDTLTVFNPVSDWYGEGDERIYVDGENMPSLLGTGTEDYYGYAWGMPAYFSSPFLSTPERDHPGRDSWRGYTTDSRLRLLDGIPFEKQLKHDMEIWHWANTQVDYSVGIFWYALPGATCNRAPQPDEARIPVKNAFAARGKVNTPGAIECESLPRTLSPGTASEVQSDGLQNGAWSGGQQLFVRATKVGDYVELTLPVSDDQPRRVTVYGTKSRDYGIVRFSINGTPVGKDFDGYDLTAEPSGPIDLGIATPKDGKLILRAEVVGTNPDSKGERYFLGLDCVTLVRP